jgi:adenylylsulfate kinase
MLILMAGLPGTGKSTIARELAVQLDGTVLDKDQIRSALFASRDIEYSTAQDDFVMGVMLQVARYIYERDSARRIFIDGRPFAKRYQLDNVIASAKEMGAEWRILECVCSEESARKRLESGSGEHPAANRTFELYEKMKAEFEPIILPKTVLDTDQPLVNCVHAALRAFA